MTRRRRALDSLDRDIRAHLDQETQDLIARGFSPEAARREALRRFGRIARITEDTRDIWVARWLQGLWRDLWYALRVLRRAPVFTVAIVATLALCIGANTAIFTVVDRLLLRSPYPDSDRLATVATHVQAPQRSINQTSQDGRVWFALQDARTVDVGMASGTNGVNLSTGDHAEYVTQQRVSAGYFHVLGDPPVRGREFTADEDRDGGPAAAILSDGLWRRAFAADPDIIGRAVTIRGEPYTVVGIMPPSFWSLQHVDVWTPLRPSVRGEGAGSNYGMVARLKSGVTWPAAGAELEALGTPALADRLREDAGVSAHLVLLPFQQQSVRDARLPLLVLWGAVGLVLVIGCVNVAALLLTRGVSRTSEIATRIAIGGGRGVIARQVLIESLVLASCGGAAGLLVGLITVRALVARFADALGWATLQMDGRVFAAGAAIALITGVVFGLVPALHAGRVDVRGMMTGASGLRAGSRGHSWTRRLLVASEVGLGAVLLVCAGLLLRTFWYLNAKPAGFDGTNVLTATLSLQDARYEGPEAVDRLFTATLTRMRQIPGVQSAAVSLTLPYERALNNGWRFVGEPSTGEVINLTYVTPGYFDTFRIPVIGGRTFTDGDGRDAPPVVIVNEAFVRAHGGGSTVLGRQLSLGGRAVTIVGVVGNVLQKRSFGDYEPLDETPAAYVPAAQTSGFPLLHTWFSPSWSVRTSGPVAGLPRAMTDAVRSVDPLLPFQEFRTVDEVRAGTLAVERAMATILAALALLAVVLAGIGIFGLVSATVTDRTRELGIRLALGATPTEAIWTAIGPNVAWTVVALAVGLGVAWGACRVLRALVWGISTQDGVTFLGAAAVILAAAGIASLVPAIRIARLDPARTLRSG